MNQIFIKCYQIKKELKQNTIHFNRKFKKFYSINQKRIIETILE
jgi:hypothetical protein